MKKLALFVFLLFLFDGVFAADDPFVVLQKNIAAMEQTIQQSGFDGGCMNQFGKEAYPFYKTLVLTPKQQEIEKQEKELSSLFNNQSQNLNSQIEKRIIIPYSQSNLACSFEGKMYFETNLKKIISEKNALSQQIVSNQTLYQKYGKEYDKSSKQSHIFEETQNTYIILKKKFKVLMEGFSSLSFSAKNAFSLSAGERSNISAGAASAAADLREEFWGSVSDALFEPLYQERSSLLSHLKGLPNKRSKFTTVFAGFGGDIFSPKAIESINKKTDEYIKNQAAQSSQLIQAIGQKKAQEKELQSYEQSIELNAKARLEPERYSEAYTQSVIRSLDPAKQSIVETTKQIEKSAKSLDSRNAAQKRE